VTATIHVGPLLPGHRSRLEEIVRATGVFSIEELTVAVQLFDSALGSRPSAFGEGWSADSREPRADYEFIGAFDGDQLIGYVCFGSTPSTDRTYDLYWIAVHPEAQGVGAGAALMSAVERQLWERRARLVVIETSSREDYAPTRRFYHKRGYQETARLRDFYAPGDDRVVLTKRVGVHQPPPYE
jgi:ribosomal protein S18 acetylase RimI-like enzyme